MKVIEDLKTPASVASVGTSEADQRSFASFGFASAASGEQA